MLLAQFCFRTFLAFLLRFFRRLGRGLGCFLGGFTFFLLTLP